MDVLQTRAVMLRGPCDLHEGTPTESGRAKNLTRSLGSFTTFPPSCLPAPPNTACGPGPGVGGRARDTQGGALCAQHLGVVLAVPLLPSLTAFSLFLPPVPSFHHSSRPGPSLPDRGEAPSEALQRTLFCLCTVSATACLAFPGGPVSLPSWAGGLRPLSLLWAATQLPERGRLWPPPEHWAPGTGLQWPRTPAKPPSYLYTS